MPTIRHCLVTTFSRGDIRYHSSEKLTTIPNIRNVIFMKEKRRKKQILNYKSLRQCFVSFEYLITTTEAASPLSHVDLVAIT